MLVGEPVDHGRERGVAAREVREDGFVLEPVMARDGVAVARAECAERPVVLAHRHLVQRRARVAGGERALTYLLDERAQLAQLAPQHVVDVDQVLANLATGVAVGDIRRRGLAMRACRLIPRRLGTQARAVVGRRRDAEALVLGGRLRRDAGDQLNLASYIDSMMCRA